MMLSLTSLLTTGFLLIIIPHLVLSTKQGDPLADMLFKFFMVKVWTSIRQSLSAAGFGVPYTPVQTNLFGDHPPGTLTDLSYVDGGAFPHEIVDNSLAVRDAQSMTKIVARACYAHALHPNFKRGKSEILIVLRGPDSAPTKQFIFVIQNSIIDVEIYPGHFISLHVVPLYRHLSNYTTPSLKTNAHVQYRISQGQSAFVPLSKHVLASKRLSLRTRSLLASSLIVSKLYYNLHIWCFVFRPTNSISHCFSYESL